MANWQGLEKRSAYALTKEEPVQDGGIYRIAHCWRKPGTQKFLVCRYLFVRCDKEPAPCSTEGVPNHIVAKVKERDGNQV
ncbi:hypothetical protein WJX79_004500 [Trebouxia sp. C0005]